jgi:hypothetical protein
VGTREHDLGRYFGSSLKAEAGIEWDDPQARLKRSWKAWSRMPIAC